MAMEEDKKFTLNKMMWEIADRNYVISGLLQVISIYVRKTQI